MSKRSDRKPHGNLSPEDVKLIYRILEWRKRGGSFRDLYYADYDDPEVIEAMGAERAAEPELIMQFETGKTRPERLRDFRERTGREPEVDADFYEIYGENPWEYFFGNTTHRQYIRRRTLFNRARARDAAKD